MCERDAALYQAIREVAASREGRALPTSHGSCHPSGAASRNAPASFCVAGSVCACARASVGLVGASSA